MRSATLFTVLTLALPPAGAAQEAPDPFAAFETHVLSNGLRLWYGRLPGATRISVGLSVPYGSDEDPRGKEELAHFTEHMLFSDHDGRSEQEILDEVDARGGTRNGFTAPDRTFYFVTLPAEHGLFGIEWLHGILEPKAMAPDVVEKNRQPLALEIRARPREFFEHVWYALNPEWLRQPDYWEREFGLVTRDARVYDRWESLHAITPEDLRQFYDRYYAPEAMTAVVVGDVDREAVLSEMEATFGTLAAKTAPPTGYGELVDPGRPYKKVLWTYRPNVRYRRILKLYDMDATEHVRLLFLSRYLDRRLSNRLRFGDTKAVYGVDVSVVVRGPAAHLYLAAPIDKAQWDYARDVIEEELRMLADGSLPAEQFAADRSAVVERLRAEEGEPQDLVFWVYRAFYDRKLHEDFPHLTAEFAALTPDDLSGLVAGLLAPERQVVYIDRPQPLTQGLLAVLAALLGFLTFRGTARLLTRPVSMRDIRYVARLRGSPVVVLLLGTTYLGLGLVVFRLAAAGVDRVVSYLIFPLDVYPLHMAAFAAVASAALAGIVLYLSLPPRKLLLFPEELRIKHLAFRSRGVPVGELTARLATWRDVVAGGAGLRTLPLTLGLMRPGVWLRPAEGAGYLVHVRDAGELLDVLEEAGADVVR